MSLRLTGADVVEGERKLSLDAYRERHCLVMIALQCRTLLRKTFSEDALELQLGFSGTRDNDALIELKARLLVWDETLFEGDDEG